MRKCIYLIGDRLNHSPKFQIMMNEALRTIMTPNPITVNPDQTVSEVKSILMTHRIHHVPVAEEGRLVGIVTTYDLWQMGKSFDDYDKIKVKDIMTEKIAKLSPNAKIGTAAELFLSNRFHAIPIVDGERLVGIVTSFDVMRYNFRKEYPRPILFQEVFERANKAVA